MLAASLLLGVGLAPNAAEAQDTFYLEIMAHDGNTGSPIGLSLGHAFMCIGTPLQSGIEEDCYAFNAREGDAGESGGWVAGPGIRPSQITDTSSAPSRFSPVSVRVKRNITSEQRQEILGQVVTWNERRYPLSNQNCIDLMAELARAAGWSVPPHVEAELPVSWITRLRDANPERVPKAPTLIEVK